MAGRRVASLLRMRCMRSWRPFAVTEFDVDLAAHRCQACAFTACGTLRRAIHAVNFECGLSWLCWRPSWERRSHLSRILRSKCRRQRGICHSLKRLQRDGCFTSGGCTLRQIWQGSPLQSHGRDQGDFRLCGTAMREANTEELRVRVASRTQDESAKRVRRFYLTEQVRPV